MIFESFQRPACAACGRRPWQRPGPPSSCTWWTRGRRPGRGSTAPAPAPPGGRKTPSAPGQGMFQVALCLREHDARVGVPGCGGVGAVHAGRLLMQDFVFADEKDGFCPTNRPAGGGAPLSVGCCVGRERKPMCCARHSSSDDASITNDCPQLAPYSTLTSHGIEHHLQGLW